MDKFNTLKTLLERDRSYRRFDASQAVSRQTLSRLIDLTRFCASGRNLQPLRYRLVTDAAECELVFPLLKWAGYLADWDGPEAAERPTAYIVQCIDTSLAGGGLLCDDGLQLQAITLGATALGLGGCIIKSFNVPELSKLLGIDCRYKPHYVFALGYPVEEVVIEEMPSDGDYKYWRTPDRIHHVPKRSLEDLII